jgi:hypothetical protein
MKTPVNRFNSPFFYLSLRPICPFGEIKKLSERGFNLSNKRHYSINSMPANSNNGQLGASDPNPFYITGLIDAEGCFMVE